MTLLLHVVADGEQTRRNWPNEPSKIVLKINPGKFAVNLLSGLLMCKSEGRWDSLKGGITLYIS